MNRILASLLLIFVILLAACSGAATPAAETPAVDAPAAEEPVAESEEAAPQDTSTEEATPEESNAAEAEAETATEGAVTLPEVNPLEVTGDIVTAGSSTVYPLSEAMAERFADEGYAGNITIDSIGTGGGFERFCVAGEIDIANASRAIKEEEIASCESINRTPIEFRVGTDALAIVTHPDNDFLTDVTLEQLALIFSADVTNWNEVDPTWPAEPILRFSPGTDSGTFDYFIEAVMAPTFGEEAEAKLLDAANLQLSEDDNVLVQGVEGDVNAIGYFGYAYYEENADRLNILSIEGVEPGAQSVDDGSYPLARPLFIYSDATVMQEKPQVAAFINFYLTYANEEVEAVGYFPASEEALDTAKQSFLAAVGE
jgi:phosphate transport system substrate-binding protein